MNTVKCETKVVYCIVVSTLLLFMLPFILFGENSIVTIHDNLDFEIAHYKMFKDNGLFFKFDAPTSGLSEMSTLYYSFVSFSFSSLLYYFFDIFPAYTINYCLSIL
jgi:hypothetical protein